MCNESFQSSFEIIAALFSVGGLLNRSAEQRKKHSKLQEVTVDNGYVTYYKQEAKLSLG